MRVLRNALLICVLVSFLVSPVSATSVLEIQPWQAVDQSELIFVGRVVERQFVPSGDGTFPFTFVTFKVSEIFKGRIEGQEITLRLHGGDLPGSRESVEVVGMPTFEVGQEALLFVAGNGDLGCPIVGWWQGKLELVAHPQTGDRVLVSHQGALVEGLETTSWNLSDVRYDGHEKRLRVPEPVSQVLWQEGVTIVQDTASNKALSNEGVEAEEILGQLRALVAKRRLEKSFVADQLVSSASPHDVPETVQFRAAKP